MKIFKFQKKSFFQNHLFSPRAETCPLQPEPHVTVPKIQPQNHVTLVCTSHAQDARKMRLHPLSLLHMGETKTFQKQHGGGISPYTIAAVTGPISAKSTSNVLYPETPISPSQHPSLGLISHPLSTFHSQQQHWRNPFRKAHPSTHSFA